MNAIEGRHDSRITAIDPYPSPRLESLSNVTVRSVGGLEVTVDDLGLAAGDLLFIDSTHTVRTGSEVPYLYLDVLPQLPPGVIVQIHDIFLPHLYVPHVYSEFFDWQETTLVAALLVNNDQLEVLACMSALHEADPKALATAFPEYRPRRLTAGVYDDAQPGHFPSSLWLRTAA
jgi:hypothetical protein